MGLASATSQSRFVSGPTIASAPNIATSAIPTDAADTLALKDEIPSLLVTPLVEDIHPAAPAPRAASPRSAAPTMPSRSICSTSRAARLYPICKRRWM